MNKKILTILLCSLFIFIGNFSFSQVCLSGWKYKIPMSVITVFQPNDLANFQVKIDVNTAALIAAGKMKSDGSDIRFFDASGDCCEELCYSIESGINTASTRIWVKVPFLPKGIIYVINMAYGNPTATTGMDGECTFDFWEGFNNPTMKFTTSCGAITDLLMPGFLNLSWVGKGMIIADSIFPMSNIYTAEMFVLNASGNWPGITWARSSNASGYSLVTDTSKARIGKRNTVTADYCKGENWVSPELNYSSVYGIWKHTWVATGNIQSDFPTVGALTSTDAIIAKNTPLRLTIGGIETGTGSTLLDWVRVRKWALDEPVVSVGVEISISYESIDLGADSLTCFGSPVNLSAPGTFLSWLWSNGASTNNISVTGPGTWWVVAADTNHCPATDTFSITVHPDPGLTIGNDSTICSGDSISLMTAGGFTNYLWSTGDSTNATVTSAGGANWVQVEDSFGCIYRDTMNLTLSPLPTISLGNDTSFCEGNSLTLDAGSGFYVYSWSTGSSLSQIMVKTSNVYWVEKEDISGCSNSDTIEVIVNPNPIVNLGLDMEICASDTLTLDAGTGGTYLWNDLSTDQTLNVSSPGNYWVTKTNVDGCYTSDTIRIDTISKPTASFSWSGPSLTITFNNTSSGAISHFWDFDDGSTSTLADPVHTFAANGSYNVCLTETNSDDCTAEFCSTVTVPQVGIQDELSGNKIEIFPNPAREILYVRFNLTDGIDINFEVIDLRGIRIYDSGNKLAKENTFEIPVSEFAPGIYFLRIISDKGSRTEKIIVQ